ncbi:MAG: replication-associated recombination protein A [Acidimicrobiia bacterium]
MTGSVNLFDDVSEQTRDKFAPLAARMRPQTFEEIVGHHELIDVGRPFRSIIESSPSASFILFGPPGCGKTTLVNVIANQSNHHLEMLIAMGLSVNDIKTIANSAALRLGERSIRTIVFIDEIHRLTRVQQDALLPHVERGTFRLIGATTENPYVTLSAALRSRMSIYPMYAPSKEDIYSLLERAMKNDEQLKASGVDIDNEMLDVIATSANGDVRFALGVLETFVAASTKSKPTLKLLEEVLGTRQRPTGGQEHYDTLSAFIKSMRASDMQATSYYLARLIDAGEDPLAIARRIMIAASEDVGLADSRVLTLCASAAQAITMVGMPEARIILSHAALAVARAPKSNSAYLAVDAALSYVKNNALAEIPDYLRDSTSQSAYKNSETFSKETYKYPHDFGGKTDQRYLPESVTETFYSPTNNGADSKQVES